MVLDVMEFIRRFLQHVLPKGFVKIRYYGSMSPGSSVSLERIRSLIELAFGFDLEQPPAEADPLPVPSCPDCGGRLKLRFRLRPFVASRTRYG